MLICQGKDVALLEFGKSEGDIAAPKLISADCAIMGNVTSIDRNDALTGTGRRQVKGRKCTERPALSVLIIRGMLQLRTSGDVTRNIKLVRNVEVNQGYLNIRAPL